MSWVFEIAQRLIQVLYWLILARVIVSFIQPQTFNPTFYNIRQGLYTVTEPLLAPVRRLMPPYSGLDFSPLIVILILNFLRRLLLSYQFRMF